VKIKRYMAASMRAALDQVRLEQGPDAVILSSRRMDEGVEVIAAVDYDEALIAGAARQYARAASAAPAEAPVPGSAAPRAVQRRAPSALARDPAAAAVPQDAHRGFATVQRELSDLRHLLEDGLANISWHDKRVREPLKARVLEELSAMDIAPDVAASLAAMTPSRTQLDDTSKLSLALLLRRLPVVDRLSTVNPGVFALVGPTGAGKTTTIAKLASRWSMQHGSEDLALVSTDSYRIGAREQLMTYARILGATMHAPRMRA
jgi:flagellar biosynthesis protein FlhF